MPMNGKPQRQNRFSSDDQREKAPRMWLTSSPVGSGRMNLQDCVSGTRRRVVSSKNRREVESGGRPWNRPKH